VKVDQSGLNWAVIGFRVLGIHAQQTLEVASGEWIAKENNAAHNKFEPASEIERYVWIRMVQNLHI
jgi:nitric oxide reductase large subunit